MQIRGEWRSFVTLVKAGYMFTAEPAENLAQRVSIGVRY